MNRDTRATVLAAIREIHDGRWVRYLGTDGGRTLEWTGRLVIVGAVTTAWDRAHDVIASMGDRFLILRMDSTEGRLGAGRQSRRNVGHEEQMRAELSRPSPACSPASTRRRRSSSPTTRPRRCSPPPTSSPSPAPASTTTTAATSSTPTHPRCRPGSRKQLVQLVRGAVAIGMDRADALRLAIRCARDSMPPLRLAIIDDLAEHPGVDGDRGAARLDKPRNDRRPPAQALHILGVLRLDEDERDDGKTTWRYSLADGIDPSTPQTVTRFVST